MFDPSKAKSEIYKQVMPLQVGYQRYAKSGLEISDWFPHIGACADDITLARGCPFACCGPVPIHPHQRDLPRGVPFPDDLFSWPLENGPVWRIAHGAGPWGILRGLLLGLYGAWLCRRGDVAGLDGPCHLVHGARKIAQIGHAITKPMGVILIIAGLAVLAMPYIGGT